MPNFLGATAASAEKASPTGTVRKGGGAASETSSNQGDEDDNLSDDNADDDADGARSGQGVRGL